MFVKNIFKTVNAIRTNFDFIYLFLVFCGVSMAACCCSTCWYRLGGEEVPSTLSAEEDDLPSDLRT